MEVGSFSALSRLEGQNLVISTISKLPNPWRKLFYPPRQGGFIRTAWTHCEPRLLGVNLGLIIFVVKDVKMSHSMVKMVFVFRWDVVVGFSLPF